MPVAHDSAVLEPEDLVDSDISSTSLGDIPQLLKSLDARAVPGRAVAGDSRTEPGSAGILGVCVSRTRATIRLVDRFVRLHFLGFSTMLVLLGGASVKPSLSASELLGLLAVALCFHNFAYVFNDVIDLPVDRDSPSRQGDLLVRGTISPLQALIFSVGQIPLATALHLALGWPVEALWILLAGFVFMGIYDLWGKACPLPPLTDLSQGLGWASLTLYGAFAVGSSPNSLTWTAFGLGCGFILLINGVHGGLRDLDNDLAKGRRTTAIFFGSRPGSGGDAPSVKPGLRIFAMAVLSGLFLVALLPLWSNTFGFEPSTLLVVGAIMVLVEAYSLRLMLRVFRTDSPTWGRDFRMHLFYLLLPPLVLFVPYLGWRIGLLVLVLFIGPVLLMPAAQEQVRTLAERWRLAFGAETR